jgi:Peptidase family M28
VDLSYWEPKRSRLTAISHDGEETSIECFALPHSKPVANIEAPLVPFKFGEANDAVRGSIGLVDVRLSRLPYDGLAGRATWTYDPEGSFAGQAQVLPFGPGAQAVMEPSMEAGASGFVGVLKDYPGDSHKYYVPYDAIERPIPGVWISGSDGERLREMLARGHVNARIEVEAKTHTETCYNIVGELPGADGETVIIGSHHDGPWSSAVEDGSGIALVLAQAAYWSRVPQGERPHRLLFLLNAGHMAGGAGVHRFIADHKEELDRVVLEVHLEHTANECVEQDGRVVATGDPEARWWFTSKNVELESAVRETLEAEDLRRSFILPPDAFGPHPTTDGGPFHAAGVPLVNFLTAPFYLFDEMDTMDKIHRPSLVPVTRAAVRLVKWTAGRSAAGMRGGVA